MSMNKQDCSLLVPLEIGTGQVENIEDRSGIRFSIGPSAANTYSDAQLFDYKGLKRFDYPNRPPLRMTVRAWASHSADELVGTAGFGFWNQPTMPGELSIRLPRAVWFFFGSRHSNMALAKALPGWGWKAATLDASRLPFLLLLPTAPLGFLMMRIPRLYDLLWPIAQRALGVSERLLDIDFTQPHTYQLDWLPHSALFYVDGRLVMQTKASPHGPLGFVAWLDNQFAVITPQGSVQMGLVPVPQRQWLALDSLSIEKL
jgi:hypothetical protein